MLDIFLVALAFICLMVGIVGSLLPILPGPPISFAGILILQFTSIEEYKTHPFLLVILALITIATLVSDYIIPPTTTRKFGGSKYGAWGSTIGGVIGIPYGPLAIIILPFIGAFIGELIMGRNNKQALRSAWGSFIGFLLSIGLKLIVCLILLGIFIKSTFFVLVNSLS